MSHGGIYRQRDELTVPRLQREERLDTRIASFASSSRTPSLIHFDVAREITSCKNGLSMRRKGMVAFKPVIRAIECRDLSRETDRS